ncbi:hypothetical protein DBV05_g12599 [Lasiodiplodia theobromae]|uniref:Uncharacterized protein n=1 Tax=Lasiodiplodia theobromae TaxID=45133 RepID=A0A5N5CTQ3_9PEZI|nr:hypothetical protein DBV05_g12599 [Lasiodiplodia theobromae]
MASSSKDKLAVPPNTPVTIKWTGPYEDREHYITSDDQPTLDFGFNPSTLKAHFKIRVLNPLKGETKKTWLYLFVRPEHIRTFDVTTTTNTTTPQLYIHLTLCQPAFLVSPRELYPPTPKNAKAENIFAELKSLACSRGFTLCRSGASEDEYTVFRAFAALLLHSGRGGIEAGAQEYRLERLYKGMGGVIVDIPAPDFFSYSDDDDGNYDENAKEGGAGEEEEDTSNDDACEKEDGEERDENAEEEEEEDNEDEQQQHANAPPSYSGTVGLMRKKRKQSGSTPSLLAPAKKRGRHGVSGLMSSENASRSALEAKRKALEAELKAVCEQLSAEQPPSYQPPISHKQSREKKLQPARISNSDFGDRVLTPRGITITYPKTAVSPFTHFRTDPPPPDARLAFYRSKPGLQDTNVWLDGEKPSIEELLEEYQILRIYEDNESEYSHYAIEALLKRERRRSQRAHNRPWRCERKLEYATKPGHLWEKPPLLVHHPDSDYNFHIRPDCSYWISLEAFSGEYSDNVQNFVHVGQNRFLCPYFSIEFKKNEKTESQAEFQVAVASAIAMYNRYKLKCDRIEHTASEWTSEHTGALRHYGLVMAGRSYKFFCTTAELDDRHSWKGCRMERLFQSTFDRPQTMPHFVNWINEIHLWGLTVHGPGCEDDIKHCIQRADKGIRVSL